ncbi:MAG: restriction endonuclease subunit S, partial [Methanosarcinales archaeon]|nr:restriction endonuclease subunit S [Methanosarcinales archaeon]
EILSTIDETIERTEALIEKYRHIKAGLMSDLLTRGIDEEGRIRSEETHEFKDSPLGRVPDEWKLGGFEHMIDKSNRSAIKPGPFGSSLKKEFYVNEGYRVYGQEQVIAGTLSVGNYYINKSKFKELDSFQVNSNDVLISLVGTVGRVLVVPSRFEPGVINPRLLKITPDKRKGDSKFISYLFISGIITSQLSNLSHGGTMDVLNGTTIKKLRFGIPDIKEQHHIAEILTTADTYIEKEQTYLNKLQQIKKGLMQDLLTGKVRVTTTPSPPKPAEAATCPT